MNIWYFADVPLYLGLLLIPLAWGWYRKPSPADGKQSWRMTVAEVAAGKFVGVAISYCLNLFVLPYLTHSEISPRDAAAISALYLAVATVRSICTRRLFEHLRMKGIN